MGVDEAVEKQQQGTMSKFKEFSVTHILREINFCEFQPLKKCHFDNFRGPQNGSL